MKTALLFLVLFLAGCAPVKKSDYTSITVFEKKERWVLPDKYVETVVAVPIENRVPPAFCVTRRLYEKTGDVYKEREIQTVMLAAYEISEERQQKLVANIFNFFRVLALVGIVAVVLGVVLFVVEKQFPAIPDVWDELIVYGGTITCIGVAGAWYVDQLIRVAIIGAIGFVIAISYTIWRRSGKKAEVREKDVAITELIGDMETYKDAARDVWDDVKAKLEHSESTAAIISERKPAVKKRRMQIPIP